MADKHECLKYMSCPKSIRKNCNDDCPNKRLQQLIERQQSRKIRMSDDIIGNGLILSDH